MTTTLEVSRRRVPEYTVIMSEKHASQLITYILDNDSLRKDFPLVGQIRDLLKPLLEREGYKFAPSERIDHD